MIRHTKGLLAIVLCFLLVICSLSMVEANNENEIITTPIGNLIKQEPSDEQLRKQAENKEKSTNVQTDEQMKKDTPNPTDYTFENRSGLKENEISIDVLGESEINDVATSDLPKDAVVPKEVADENVALDNPADTGIETTTVHNTYDDLEEIEENNELLSMSSIPYDDTFTIGDSISVWGFYSIAYKFTVQTGTYYFYLENSSYNIGLSLVDSNNTLVGEDSEIYGYDSLVRIDAELSAGTYYLIVHDYYETDDLITGNVVTGEITVEIVSPFDDAFCTSYINIQAYGTGIEMINIYANNTLIWSEGGSSVSYDYYPPSSGIYDICVEGITLDGIVSVTDSVTGISFCETIEIGETISIENSYRSDYMFTINTPTCLTLKTDFYDVSCDTQIYVYDSFDNFWYDIPLYVNDDSNGTLYSSITEIFQPGTYYITIRVKDCNYPACKFSLSSVPFINIETPVSGTWSRFENGVEISGYGLSLHHTELYVNDVLVPGSYNVGNSFDYLYSSSTPGEYTFKVIGYTTESGETTITDTTTIIITDIIAGNGSEYVYDAVAIDYQINITERGTYRVLTDYNLPFSIIDSSNNLVTSSFCDTFSYCETADEILSVGTYRLVFNNNTATNHSFSFDVMKLENLTPSIYVMDPTDNFIYSMMSGVDIVYDANSMHSLKVYMNDVLIDECVGKDIYYNSFKFMPPYDGEYTMRIEACNSKDDTIPGAQTVIEERKIYVARGAEIGKPQIINNKVMVIYAFDTELSGVYRFKVDSTSDVYMEVLDDISYEVMSNEYANYIDELECEYYYPACYVKLMSASHYENNDGTPFDGTLTVSRSELGEDVCQVKEGYTDITIEWPEQANVTSYQIYRNNTLIHTTTENISSYTDTNLPSGTQFEYKILTNGGDVYSDWPIVFLTAKTLSPVYEAESTNNIYNGTTYNNLLSGKRGVNIGASKELTISNVYSSEELTYVAKIYYLCNAEQNAGIGINGNPEIPVEFPNTNNTVQSITINLNLTKGFNDIKIVNSGSSLTIDYIEIGSLYHVGGKPYEAERLANAVSNTLPKYFGYASRGNSVMLINENSSITFDGIKVTEPGKYMLYMYYYSEANTQCVVNINTQDEYAVDLSDTDGKIAVMRFPIKLNTGDNTIQFTGNSEHSFCLDKIFVPSSYMDTLAPLEPTNLSTSVNTDNTVTIAWDDAIDNSMISRYIVYKNHQPYATVTDNTYTDNEPGDGANVYAVVAEDYNSNQSVQSKYTYSGNVVSERTITLPMNNNCYILIKGSGLDDFEQKEFYVVYNPDEIEVIDPMYINYGGVLTVTHNEPGLLKYKLNVTLAENTTWAGISNFIRVFAKSSTASILTYYK